MADEKVVKTVLKYEVDQSSVNKASASVNKVKKDLKDLNEQGKVSLNRLESQTQSAARALSGLGLSGLGDIGGQAADVLQLRNTLKDTLSSVIAVEGGIAAAGASFATALGPIVAVAAPLLLLKGIMDNLQTSTQNAVKAEQAYFDLQVKNLDRQAQLRQDAQTKTAEQNRKDFLETEKQLSDLSKLSEQKRKEREAVNKAFEELGASFNPAERSRLGALGTELDKEIQQLADRYTELSKKLGDQVVVLDPLIKNREAEENVVKRLIELQGNFNAAIEKAGEIVARARAAVIKEQKEREDRLIDVTRKANADIQDIETRSLERRAAVQDTYNKRLVDISRQAADAAASALRNLTQQREDLSRSLGRDTAKAERDARVKELDIRIEAQREEARSLREHERNKLRILEDSRDQEFELILNRDFLGLFNLRRQTTRDLGRADTDFGAEQQERRIGAGEQLDDLRRQLAAERQERLIAYQQQLADARLTYSRELAQINQQRAQQLMIAAQTRTAELRQLQTSTVAALSLRRQQAAEEIRVAGLVGQARIDFLNRERQILLQQAAAYGGVAGPVRQGGGAGRFLLRDSGGPLAAGQLAAIGVPGEAFNGYALPGTGLFQPMVPGNVTKTNTLNGTWNIQGNNPEAIGRVVRGQVNQAFRELIG